MHLQLTTSSTTHWLGRRCLALLVAVLAAAGEAVPVGRTLNHSFDPCSHPPPCLLLEKADCRPEQTAGSVAAGSPVWRARYFDADGSEITCSSDSIVICEGQERNVSCPPNWTIKVWYAAFKRSPPSFCAVDNSVPPQSTPGAKCQGHSVQWELSRMCDGLTSCLINSSAIARDEICDGRRFLRTEYTCIGSSEVYSPSQTHFFLFAVVGSLIMFGLAVLALLMTVHIKKRRRAYPLTSLQAPLTEYENPEA